MTVATDLLHPDIEKVFLAEVTCGEALEIWTLYSESPQLTTYSAPAVYNMVDVKEDGTSLTSRASIALVSANAGSYYYDSANDLVYVHTTLSADPHTVTIQAINKFYYGNRGKTINSQYYEPRLESAPNLSLRVETKFTGISQISGGNMTFSNGDGFYDDLANLQWDAGEVVLLLGTDRQTEMAYGDYVNVGTWLIKNWSLTDTVFSLSLSEYKVKIKKKIPLTFYDRLTYPRIDQEDIGKPIQIAYGMIMDARPALIDIASRKFKVAGHAIHEYVQVRVLDDTTNQWNIKSFETTDEANGEFTLSASDWTYNEQVAVDFKGKERSANVLMDNASDIVKDILETYLGESASTNAASFTESYNRLDGGQFLPSDDRRTYRGLGLYINEVETVEEILQQVNFSVGSYLFANSSGEFIYKVFWPSASEGLTKFTDKEIRSYSESTDNSGIFSKAKINYDRRLVREWSEFKTYEFTKSQHLHDEQSVKLTVKDTLLYDSDDAETLAERTINYEGEPLKLIKIVVTAREAMLLFPGDFVQLVYERHNIDGVYEIMEISHNLLGDTTNMVLGDAHGLKDSSGFWSNASDTLPARFANEAGYNGGAIAWNGSESDALATYKIQNYGYWTDSNGYSLTADTRTLKKSTWV